MHCTTRSVLTSFLRPSVIQSSALPSFLVPSISLTQVSSFSNTPSHNARKDRNPNRGISALRRTGLRKRQTLSVKLEDLPKPVLDPERRSKVQTNPEHGLNDFFNQEAETPGLMTPRELKSHGRGWTVLELRRKDWDDIWRLWWVCVKERNRIMTFLEERQRMGGQIDGASEAMGRMKEIKKTMKAIKHTLTERWYAWDNARYAAMEDEEVNLYAAGTDEDPAYIPIAEAEAENTTDEVESDTEDTLPPDETQPLPPPNNQRSPSEARL